MAAVAPRARGVDVQEHVELMLLDVFLEGLYDVDLRRVNSEEVLDVGGDEGVMGVEGGGDGGEVVMGG